MGLFSKTKKSDPVMGEELKEATPSSTEVPGVVGTRVGYTGGTTSNPTYSTVCSGRTGHSEAVRIEYDPTKVSYEQLVDKFFKMHSYTSKAKPQYMSAIFAQNDQQRKVASAKISSLSRCATEIKGQTQWWDAEEYHQNYIKKRNSRFF